MHEVRASKAHSPTYTLRYSLTIINISLHRMGFLDLHEAQFDCAAPALVPLSISLFIENGLKFTLAVQFAKLLLHMHECIPHEFHVLVGSCKLKQIGGYMLFYLVIDLFVDAWHSAVSVTFSRIIRSTDTHTHPKHTFDSCINVAVVPSN